MALEVMNDSSPDSLLSRHRELRMDMNLRRSRSVAGQVFVIPQSASNESLRL